MREWLSELESEYQIEILFACEAGSRAWGISNEESDFDVRFLFRYRDLKKYLSLRKPPSVLQFQTPYDVSGFDLYKWFELIQKSNPSLFEWAFSKIVYKEKNHFSEVLQQMIESAYSPFSLIQHYQSLKKRNQIEVEKGDYSLKKQKQLIQAVRAELISSGIFLAQKVCSPYELINQSVAFCPELYRTYQLLTNAKKNSLLLSSNYVQEIMEILDNPKWDVQEVKVLQKMKPSINDLEKWLWEILGMN